MTLLSIGHYHLLLDGGDTLKLETLRVETGNKAETPHQLITIGTPNE